MTEEMQSYLQKQVDVQTRNAEQHRADQKIHEGYANEHGIAAAQAEKWAEQFKALMAAKP